MVIKRNKIFEKKLGSKIVRNKQLIRKGKGLR